MLNPPINEIGEPFRIENECFILQRKGIDFEVKVDGLGKMSGKGMLVLTTSRIVLVNTKNLAKSDLKAFDIPLAYTFSEKFNQPIFGANYWSGACKPLFNSLPGDAHFKIWFMEGGCGKFNNCYRYTLKQIRQNVGGGVPQSLIQEVQSSSFQQQFAYFDPNDPSTIYISQPPVQQQPKPQQQPKQAPLGYVDPQSHQFEESKSSQVYPQVYGSELQSSTQVGAGLQQPIVVKPEDQIKQQDKSKYNYEYYNQ